MGGLGSTGIPPEHRRREARRRPEARRAPRRRSTARTRGEKAWGGRPAHPEAVGVDSEACGGRNRWRWCSERAVRGRGRRLGDGDPQLPGSIPRAETKRRLRRSSRRRWRGLRWLQSPATRRGAAAAMAAESMARVRVCRGGGAGERERDAVRCGPLLYPPGGPGRGERHGVAAAWRQ